MNDVFNGVGVKIKLASADDFLKVKETLTRLGIASERTKTLYQSCHILHKRGEYAIVHFKELFALDGKPATIDQEDIQRRNTIALLLQDWGLVTLVDQNAVPDDGGTLPMRLLKVIPFKEKSGWNLVSKYKIGWSKEMTDVFYGGGYVKEGVASVWTPTSNFEKVKEFMATFGQNIATAPSLGNETLKVLRYDLVREECEELADALEADNLVEAADALTDILYVVYGAAAAFGIDIDKCFDEVHRSNMSKLGADGKPIYREDGKVLKGPGYFKPDLESMIYGAKKTKSDAEA